MTKLQYIQRVCLENEIEATIAHFLSSSEDQYHADRHVSTPPVGLPSFAACEAGLALLLDWTAKVGPINRAGLFASTPILMIDDEWLSNEDNAPPPHVLLSLFKTFSRYLEQPIAGVKANPANTPLNELLSKSLSRLAVYRVAPNEDFPSSGAWVIQPEDVGAIQDSRKPT